MKPKLNVYWFALLIFMLAAICCWFIFRPAWSKKHLPSVQVSTPIPAAPTAINTGRQQAAINTPAPQANQAIPSSRVATRVGPHEATEDFVQSRNVPVEFFGKVIDQDGNPLANVDVKVIVQQLTIPDITTIEIAAKSIPIEVATGTDGRFEISGLQGVSFDLESIQRSGYEAEPTKRGHPPAGGTFDQPVIFKMWNTNIHEQLITGNKNFHIIPDGRVYVINLESGSISESGIGDLKVWVKRPMNAAYGQKYDWSCGLYVMNGGLREVPSGTPMYMAPPDGYRSSFSFEQKTGSGWGDTTGPKQFFINLSNGQQYGQISIELEAYHNEQIPGLVHLSYVINPSGSRILR